MNLLDNGKGLNAAIEDANTANEKPAFDEEKTDAPKESGKKGISDGFKAYEMVR